MEIIGMVALFILFLGFALCLTYMTFAMDTELWFLKVFITFPLALLSWIAIYHFFIEPLFSK